MPTAASASPPGAKRVAKPKERAQVVWARARELVDPLERHDSFAVALDLLRTAHHDPTQMAHALRIGRTHVRGDANDTAAAGGVRILERAIKFLGVKPTAGEVADGSSR
jgi:hypothetical protein